MFPDIVKSLEQPFSLIAGCLLLFSVIIFYWAKRRARGPNLSRIAILGGIFSLIVVLFSTYSSVTQLELEREYTRLHATFSVHVVIEGTVVGTKNSTLTFQTSSGQVNVGCNEQVPARVSWTPPPGATVTGARAEWRNTDNVRAAMVNPTSLTGNPVVATGTIVGLERNFLLNCPGGGHGELILLGTYDISEKEPRERQELKTLDDKVNRSQPLVISIPTGQDITPQTGEITILGDGNETEDIKIAFKGVDDAATMVTQSKGNIPYTLSL